jgi:hypothetical protein
MASDSSRPVKRQRTESAKLVENILPPDKFERSSEVWYEDGNVIIRAESTLFRVHRSILSAHSPVLRNSLASLSDVYPSIIDGCPVLSLVDSAMDTSHFLKAMIDRRYIFFRAMEAQILNATYAKLFS